MLKNYIILGIGLLIIVGAVLIFYPATKTSNQPEPIITPDETPEEHFPKTPRPTSPPPLSLNFSNQGVPLDFTVN
jgi:hypothetical protein